MRRITSYNVCYTKLLRDYAKSRKSKITNIKDSEILEFIEERFTQNREIILSRGDIEEYFPTKFKGKSLENVIELLEDDNYTKWKTENGYKELRKLIERALKIKE